MIISKKIDLEINKGNLPYYRKFDKNIKIGSVLTLDVNKLSKSSNLEVSVKCDICGGLSKASIKKHNRSFGKHNSFACSKKCSALRSKYLLEKKHGVNNISQVPEVKNKIKKTNLNKYGSEYYFGSDVGIKKNKEIFLEKYGVDSPQKNKEIRLKTFKTNNKIYGHGCILSSPIIRKKIEETNFKKYGSKTPLCNSEIKDKISKTNQEKYGGNSPMCSDEIKKKSKNTVLKKYGVSSVMKLDSTKLKSKKTNLDKLGYEYPMQSDVVKEKRRKNNTEKWGVPHYHQYDHFRKNFKVTNDKNYIRYLSDGYSLFKCDIGKEHNFKIKFDNYHVRKKTNTPLCTVCNPIGESISIKENEVLKFIENNYGGKVIRNYRDGLEVDIYLPELNIGFEFNGLYWHSEKWKDRNYHIDKTTYFAERGIRIIHIWEDDWDFNRDILKSQILNWINKSSVKIYARKCSVREISDSKLYRDFLEENHIQGYYIGIKCKLGLFYEEQLVSLMTFDKLEGRKKMNEKEWNLSRFCNKKNITVVGGASKLFKYFLNEYNPERVISYVDRDWSIGNMYDKLGFEMVNISKPDYKYVVGQKRVHKTRYSKSKTGISESKLDINRIYDCGKIKYEYK